MFFSPRGLDKLAAGASGSSASTSNHVQAASSSSSGAGGTTSTMEIIDIEDCLPSGTVGRDNQREAFGQICQALDEGYHVVAQYPTGMGKTLYGF